MVMEVMHLVFVRYWNLFAYYSYAGKEVAKFTKLKYTEILTSLESFQSCDYELALRQSFHRLDETLEDTVNRNFRFCFPFLNHLF